MKYGFFKRLAAGLAVFAGLTGIVGSLESRGEERHSSSEMQKCYTKDTNIVASSSTGQIAGSVRDIFSGKKNPEIVNQLNLLSTGIKELALQDHGLTGGKGRTSRAIRITPKTKNVVLYVPALAAYAGGAAYLSKRDTGSAFFPHNPYNDLKEAVFELEPNNVQNSNGRFAFIDNNNETGITFHIVDTDLPIYCFKRKGTTLELKDCKTLVTFESVGNRRLCYDWVDPSVKKPEQHSECLFPYCEEGSTDGGQLRLCTSPSTGGGQTCELNPCVGKTKPSCQFGFDALCDANIKEYYCPVVPCSTMPQCSVSGTSFNQQCTNGTVACTPGGAQQCVDAGQILNNTPQCPVSPCTSNTCICETINGVDVTYECSQGTLVVQNGQAICADANGNAVGNPTCPFQECSAPFCSVSGNQIALVCSNPSNVVACQGNQTVCLKQNGQQDTYDTPTCPLNDTCSDLNCLFGGGISLSAECPAGSFAACVNGEGVCAQTDNNGNITNITDTLSCPFDAQCDDMICQAGGATLTKTCGEGTLACDGNKAVCINANGAVVDDNPPCKLVDCDPSCNAGNVTSNLICPEDTAKLLCDPLNNNAAGCYHFLGGGPTSGSASPVPSEGNPVCELKTCANPTAITCEVPGTGISEQLDCGGNVPICTWQEEVVCANPDTGVIGGEPSCPIGVCNPCVSGGNWVCVDNNNQPISAGVSPVICNESGINPECPVSGIPACLLPEDVCEQGRLCGQNGMLVCNNDGQEPTHCLSSHVLSEHGGISHVCEDGSSATICQGPCNACQDGGAWVCVNDSNQILNNSLPICDGSGGNPQCHDGGNPACKLPNSVCNQERMCNENGMLVCDVDGTAPTHCLADVGPICATGDVADMCQGPCGTCANNGTLVCVDGQNNPIAGSNPVCDGTVNGWGNPQCYEGGTPACEPGQCDHSCGTNGQLVCDNRTDPTHCLQLQEGGPVEHICGDDNGSLATTCEQQCTVKCGPAERGSYVCRSGNSDYNAVCDENGANPGCPDGGSLTCKLDPCPSCGPEQGDVKCVSADGSIREAQHCYMSLDSSITDPDLDVVCTDEQAEYQCHTNCEPCEGDGTLICTDSTNMTEAICDGNGDPICDNGSACAHTCGTCSVTINGETIDTGLEYSCPGGSSQLFCNANGEGQCAAGDHFENATCPAQPCATNVCPSGLAPVCPATQSGGSVFCVDGNPQCLDNNGNIIDAVCPVSCNVCWDGNLPTCNVGALYCQTGGIDYQCTGSNEEPSCGTVPECTDPLKIVCPGNETRSCPNGMTLVCEMGRPVRCVDPSTPDPNTDSGYKEAESICVATDCCSGARVASNSLPATPECMDDCDPMEYRCRYLQDTIACPDGIQSNPTCLSDNKRAICPSECLDPAYFQLVCSDGIIINDRSTTELRNADNEACKARPRINPKFENVPEAILRVNVDMLDSKGIDIGLSGENVPSRDDGKTRRNSLEFYSDNQATGGQFYSHIVSGPSVNRVNVKPVSGGKYQATGYRDSSIVGYPGVSPQRCLSSRSDRCAELLCRQNDLVVPCSEIIDNICQCHEHYLNTDGTCGNFDWCGQYDGAGQCIYYRPGDRPGGL